MSNQAAWLTEAKANPLKIDSAPMSKPGKDEVLIEAAAWAINPVDWKLQDSGMVLQNYPCILGSDVAGTVVEVGEGVSHVKPGDRVLGWCLYLATGKTSDAAFQTHPICRAVAKIPSHVSFAQAAVLPLSIATASVGLFQKAHLALPYPSKEPKPTNKLLLVWGGSSSVGSSVIQLARAAGVTVWATASTKRHGYVKEIGAERAFDYSQDGVAESIATAIKESGKEFIGVYDSISEEDTWKCISPIISSVGTGHVVGVLPPPFPGYPPPDTPNTSHVVATTIITNEPEVGKAVFIDYVGEALEAGMLLAKPDPIVVEGGLGSLQEAFTIQKKGVSAAKVVVVA
ncbi:oxidoreductase-like protein [Aulographum hederae CBS 113979]|uniref:Oxidoreductase-like protein n=1 Tax=Aulographum hederae CBS 113979 TaxID=1176131 RepID=A0A6G1HD07_9PEZI|nr:oxidoreductase-like protein [Aulographum hederae CBS 113979]